MNHIFDFSYVQAMIVALGPRFGLVLVAPGCLLWLPGVAIWAIFEIFWRAGDI